jgi:hypothetical protein
MRLIDADQLEQTLTGAINMMTAMAAAIGAEEDEGVQMELKAYKDILDGVKGQETINAITEDWVEQYADWLTTIPAPFAANDEKSIRAMLTKWRTNPDLKTPRCNEDTCSL